MDGDSAAVTRRDVLRGAAGAVGIAAASGTATAQEEDGDDGTGDQGDDGGNGTGAGSSADGGDGGGGGTETVAVGPGGDFVFTPGTDSPLYIKPGTTVEFVWESDNHNVVVDEQPSDANWEGVPEIHNTGYTAEFTFEVNGKYHYVCEPHEDLGMVGDIEVTDTLPSGAGEGGHTSILPDGAKTLGVAAVGAMTSVLGLAYVFMKYGGDYNQAIEEAEQ